MLEERRVLRRTRIPYPFGVPGQLGVARLGGVFWWLGKGEEQRGRVAGTPAAAASNSGCRS